MVLEIVAKFLANWRQYLKVGNLVKVYLVFAFLHSCSKVARFVLNLSKFKKATEHLKGMRPDLTGKDAKENMHRFMEFLHENVDGNYDETFLTSRNPQPEIVAVKPAAVKWLLHDEFQNITKPDPLDDGLFRMLREFIGDSGIFTVRHGPLLPAENEMWYRQRKTGSLMFTKKKMMMLMYPVFVEKANVMRKVLSENSGNQVDMQEKFFCFTFDSISRIFFNRDVDSISGGEDPFATSFDGAHRAMMRYLLANVPVYLAKKLLLPFPLGETAIALNEATNADYLEFKQHVRDLKRQVGEVVQKLRDNKTEKGASLMSFFQDGYTDEELAQLCLNFLIAGRDTTACLLSWLFFELSMNPQVQEKLLEEIQSVVGDDGTPTYEQLLSEMPYLHGCIMEALRLHPPVPFDVKQTTCDLTGPDGTFVPAGTRVSFAPYSMGRNPAVYPEPMKFDPTRWYENPEPSLYEFPVFQAGNRFCLGKDMARFEAKLLTTMLIQKFKFSIDPQEAKNVSPALMLTMSICNNFEKRSFNLWLTPEAR